MDTSDKQNTQQDTYKETVFHTVSFGEKSSTPHNRNLELPGLNEGYKIFANEHYIEEKKQKRPLSLSSLKDLLLVKEGTNDSRNESNGRGGGRVVPINSSDTVTTPQSDDKKRLRTLMIASAALAKFRQHATTKKKEKRLNIAESILSRGAGQMTINDGKRLSIIEIDEMFENMVCRRYNKHTRVGERKKQLSVEKHYNPIMFAHSFADVAETSSLSLSPRSAHVMYHKGLLDTSGLQHQRRRVKSNYLVVFL